MKKHKFELEIPNMLNSAIVITWLAIAILSTFSWDSRSVIIWLAFVSMCSLIWGNK